MSRSLVEGFFTQLDPQLDVITMSYRSLFGQSTPWVSVKLQDTLDHASRQVGYNTKNRSDRLQSQTLKIPDNASGCHFGMLFFSPASKDLKSYAIHFSRPCKHICTFKSRHRIDVHHSTYWSRFFQHCTQHGVSNLVSATSSYLSGSAVRPHTKIFVFCFSIK